MFAWAMAYYFTVSVDAVLNSGWYSLSELGFVLILFFGECLRFSCTELLFHSKPFVLPIPKDWANGQFLSSASQPLALVIQGPVPLLGARPQAVGHAGWGWA